MQKVISKKDFFKLMQNAVFKKTMDNVIKLRYIKLVRPTGRTNYLVLELNYYTKKLFSDNLLAIEMKRIEILMKKPVYFSLSILESIK